MNKEKVAELSSKKKELELELDKTDLKAKVKRKRLEDSISQLNVQIKEMSGEKGDPENNKTG